MKKVEFLNSLTEDAPVQRYYYNDKTYILSGDNFGSEGDLVMCQQDLYTIEKVYGEFCDVKDVTTNVISTTIYPIDDLCVVYVKEI